MIPKVENGGMDTSDERGSMSATDTMAPELQDEIAQAVWLAYGMDLDASDIAYGNKDDYLGRREVFCQSWFLGVVTPAGQFIPTRKAGFRVGDTVVCEGASAITGEVIGISAEGVTVLWHSTETTELADDLRRV